MGFKLAGELNICGVDVWLDAWELRVGHDWHDRISDAVAKSQFVAVIVARHFNESKWIKGEVHQALSRAKDEDRTLVLPLLADAAPVPPVLASKKYLDFGREYFVSLVRLVGLVHGRPTDSIEQAIRVVKPIDLNGVLEALAYGGFEPLIVVGTQTLKEIEKAGGHGHRGIVHFEPAEILANPQDLGGLEGLNEDESPDSSARGHQFFVRDMCGAALATSLHARSSGGPSCMRSSG